MLSQADLDFWSFKDNDAREHCHSYFQYPAMMVPQMQGALIGAARLSDPKIARIYDPFMGSGTILGEAMMRGLSFRGRDINPLAVLISLAKSVPLDHTAGMAIANGICNRAENDQSESLEASFKGREKWFRQDVLIALSRLRRSILECDRLAYRRFLWVALAETIRLTSNSRTSTYKLHARPATEIESRELDPLKTFRGIVSRNLSSMAEQFRRLRDAGWLRDDEYIGEIDVRLGDSLVEEPVKSSGLADLLVTSPPYGDNTSTVPYGQHSFLPLQWILASDIDADFDSSLIQNTHALDSRSLGGRRKNSLKEARQLLDISPAFKSAIERLKDLPPDRRSRVAAFCRDLELSIDPVLKQLREDAYMIWTTGNRRVGGHPLPMDRILIEILEQRGATLVTTIDRRILSKRMPHKNGIATTMNQETIIILRKGRCRA